MKRIRLQLSRRDLRDIASKANIIANKQLFMVEDRRWLANAVAELAYHLSNLEDAEALEGGKEDAD